MELEYTVHRGAQCDVLSQPGQGKGRGPLGSSYGNTLGLSLVLLDRGSGDFQKYVIPVSFASLFCSYLVSFQVMLESGSLKHRLHLLIFFLSGERG